MNVQMECSIARDTFSLTKTKDKKYGANQRHVLLLIELHEILVSNFAFVDFIFR